MPYILIGGQAVNYWAEVFCKTESELEPLRPFTSADIDYFGNRKDVSDIARQLGVLGAKFPHPVEITALSGIVPIQIEGVSAEIEVVRSVPGLKTEKIPSLAIQAHWNNLEIRVLDPISLLHAKAKLCLLVPQKERRDADHVKILVYCVRGFLREALRAAEQSPALVRGWLGAMEKTISLTESATGARLAKRFGVDWSNILPEREIQESLLPAAIQFREKRLPVWRRKIISP